MILELAVIITLLGLIYARLGSIRRVLVGIESDQLRTQRILMDAIPTQSLGDINDNRR